MSSEPKDASTEARPKQSQRVWRACETCRKRKVKCNGQEPCSYCLASGKTCGFKESADNASFARQQANSVESRLGRLEDSLQRFMPMAQAFESWMSNNNPPGQFPFTSPPKQDDSSAKPHPPRNPYRPSSVIQHLSSPGQNGANALSPASTTSADRDQSDGPERWLDRSSHLTRDSYGNLRFTGGTTSFLLVDALTSLQNPPIDASPASNVSKNSADVILPFFTPNKRFQAQHALPSPDGLEYPSPEIADELVSTYFSSIHHTFPIVHQQLFMDRYVKTMEGYCQGKPTSDHAFVAVMFAVFACAACVSSKLQNPNPDPGLSTATEFAGMQFYEKAQLVLWRVTGSSQMEHVQCLALLAVCNANWNTLAQSWINAGQALRRAQDLGLHRETPRSPLTSVEKEIRRRVWWSVFVLDRLLSITLGRPSGVYDDDCNVQFPLELNDADVLASLEGKPVITKADSSMAGNAVMIKIYQLAGKIARFVQSIEDPQDDDAKVKLTELDAELETWLADLPPSFKPRETNGALESHTARQGMIALFMYYSSVISLHRPFIPDFPKPTSDLNSLGRCLTAARSCISISKDTKQILPTSHQLAFAVQNVTLSGVLLLRCIVYIHEPSLVSAIIQDAEQCIAVLDSLCQAWPASQRCREIVADLLLIVRTKLAGGPSAIQDLQAAQTNGRQALFEAHYPAEYVDSGNGKRKRSADPPQDGPSYSRPRLDNTISSWRSETASQEASSSHAEMSHESGYMMHQDDGRHRVSNLRTSVENGMPPPQSSPQAAAMYRHHQMPHMAVSPSQSYQQQQHSPTHHHAHQQHAMPMPRNGHHHHQQHYPQHSSMHSQHPPISLDMHQMSHDVNQLPYSGYDFLGDDLSTLLGNVIRPHHAEPSEQTFQENAQFLWEAYRHGLPTSSSSSYPNGGPTHHLQ